MLRHNLRNIVRRQVITNEIFYNDYNTHGSAARQNQNTPDLVGQPDGIGYHCMNQGGQYVSTEIELRGTWG